MPFAVRRSVELSADVPEPCSRTVPGERWWPPSNRRRSRPFRNGGSDVADPWWEAHQVAKEAGVSWVGTDMLLVGLTRSEGIAREVLAAAGVTDDAIASRVIEANRLAARPPAPDPDAPPRPTPAAEHALGRADGFAVGLGIADRPRVCCSRCSTTGRASTPGAACPGRVARSRPSVPTRPPTPKASPDQ
jgi:hypothetical protein